MSSIYTSVWLGINEIFRSGSSIAEKNSKTQKIDWNEVDQIMLGSSVVTGCKFIELSGYKNIDEHSKVLFKIRNAFIHNGNDISINNDRLNKDAEDIVDNYIIKYGDKYFKKETNKQITYKAPIIHLITMILLQDYQEI